jgi:hypothetical protein
VFSGVKSTDLHPAVTRFSRQKPPIFLFIVSMFSSIFYYMIHGMSSWEDRLVSLSMVGIGVEGSEIEMDWGVRRAVWVVYVEKNDSSSKTRLFR